MRELLRRINKMVNELITNFGMAALAYDEDNVVDNIKELFPWMKSHFISREGGAHFFGIVLDDINGCCYIVNRGTDGPTKVANARSWGFDLNMWVNESGIHTGFSELAHAVIDSNIKNYLYNYKTVFLNSHSQGSGVLPIVQCLIAENFPKVKQIIGYAFASPPTGTEIFKKRFDEHVRSGKVKLTRYTVPNDSIDSEILRKPFGVVEVGEEIYLPKIIKYRNIVTNVLSHSTAIYGASLLQLCTNDPKYTEQDLRMLAKINSKIIN